MGTLIEQNHPKFYTPVGKTPLSDPAGKAKILMCRPDFFDVTYVINPWMTQDKEGSGETPALCDVDLAKRQWETLYQAITQQAGAEVVLMDPVQDLPDLVFTANAAFVYQDTAVIAHYKHEERQGEEPHAEAWFKAQGFRTVTMPSDVFFEGAGDALYWNGRVFAGYKTRTDITSHNLITQETGLPVLSMELIDPRFYHIDVCICPLSEDYFIYSPQAFDAYGNQVIEANVPAEKRIAVTPEEASRFACNAVSVHDTVIFNKGSDRLAGELEARGFRVIQVDLSEFLKSGGSSKCLTLRVA
jgi:N-dimethylarginine dimethylaminohydrolase